VYVCEYNSVQCRTFTRTVPLQAQVTTQPPLVPAHPSINHLSHPLFTSVPPQYSHRHPYPVLDQLPVSTPPVSRPHPCPPNPVSTQSLVKHYYSTVKFILHLVQTSINRWFKPCLCNTVVLPLESCRDDCQCNHLWSQLNTIPDIHYSFWYLLHNIHTVSQYQSSIVC